MSYFHISEGERRHRVKWDIRTMGSSWHTSTTQVGVSQWLESNVHSN